MKKDVIIINQKIPLIKRDQWGIFSVHQEVYIEENKSLKGETDFYE